MEEAKEEAWVNNVLAGTMESVAESANAGNVLQKKSSCKVFVY